MECTIKTIFSTLIQEEYLVTELTILMVQINTLM